MSVLQGLEPKSVFGFFEEICNIPHISYHEQELSNYCAQFAKERGLYYEQDEMGNVIIIGEATQGYEDVEPIIIQGHLDMVGDKLPTCPIDMEKEAIKVMIDGDYLTADGTTLGGDDGIAIAYALALLDAKDVPHPRLEVVLTVSEEVGLEGATSIDLSCCKAKRLLNIDSEDEGVFTAGCAGGMRVDCDIPLNAELKKGVVCEITTNGFLGGHSGIEIHKGRANGITTIGRFLMLLEEKTNFDIVSIVGGVKDNVIPKNVTAKIIVEDVLTLQDTIQEFNEYLNVEYGVADEKAKIVTVIDDLHECQVLNAVSKKKVITALNVMPNGVQTMSMDLPGLVETSLNLGVINLDENKMSLSFSVRSSLESAKMYIGGKVKQLTEMLGGTVQFNGQYPGWPYARESRLRDLCIKVYKEQYGKEPKVEVIHAGLECGILSSKIEDLDCISMGPDMFDVHTPDEKISISSIARVWEFLKAVLAEK